MSRCRLLASLLAVFLIAGSPAHADGLPEIPLSFHGNLHDGCSGIGQNDFIVCDGPLLSSAAVDTNPAARFDYNALGSTAAKGPYDGNWTWTVPAGGATISGPVVVQFWASCNATCVALAGEWAASLWVNNKKVAPAGADDFIIGASPSTPDVPDLLTGQFNVATPIILAAGDELTLKLENNYSDAGQGSRIYYDSSQACVAGGAAPCDTRVVFNAHDDDNDGVPNLLDECPGTPPGAAVGANGCPAAGACTASGAAAAQAQIPASGATLVDAAVKTDWTRLGDGAPYSAFVQFFRAGTKGQQDAVLRAAGLKITHDFRRYTTSVFVEGPVGAFRKLVNQPLVMRVEYNRALHYLDATQSWATRSRMVQETVGDGPYFDANGKRLTGEGVTLGIMDSGLFGAHPDFAGRITHNFKYAAAGYVDVGYADSENGGGGHGTHVTGIVAGDGTQSNGSYADAGSAPYLPGTFTSASPKSKIIHWAHGATLFVLNVAFAYQHLLDNINLPEFRSLKAVNNSYGDGAGVAYDPNATDKQLIKRIVGCGVSMVFAAGNDGGDGSADETSSTCKDPTPGVICVASYNDQGTGALNAPLSSFSSRGKKGKPAEYPDIAAPGDLSTSTCAQATPTQAICTGGDDAAAETEWQPWYGTISGTSMASPNIVSVIGLLAQAKPDITPAELEQLMQRTARKIGTGYEADPQYPGSTIHFGYGAGLVDTQAALNDLLANGTTITKAGLRPVDEEWTVLVDNADADVAEGAADIVKLTMQNYNLEGPGIMYRLTVADATDFASPALAYRVEQNVRGVPTRTTILADADGVTAAEPNPTTNTAVATMVARTGNVISFFVPYAQLDYPPINEPIHNIRVLALNDAGTLDYAPSPTNGTVATAAVRPMFGRAFTTRLAPGALPPSNERACELPGLTRVTSGAGTTGDSSQSGMDDLRRLWVAEPGDMPGKVVFTVKVDNLNPAPIANYRWYVYFNTPHRTDVEAQFVAMDTVAPGGSSAAPGFKRGYRDTVDNPAAPLGVFTIEGDLPGSSFKTDGTITLVLDKAQFGLVTGNAITGLAVSIRQTSNPNNGAGLTVDSASALEPYIVVGNLPCAVDPVLPVAALTADITSGPAPLSVAFDASGSSSAAGPIASYTFDFGDGTAPVTQAGATIEHTYTTVNNFTATVTVKDSTNAASTNLAQVAIEVLEMPTGGGTTGTDSTKGKLGDNAVGAVPLASLLVLGLCGLARRRRRRR